ncbi:hypothetical protein RJ641_012260 [Dillenia turbinata]|uniref:Uncharacterized protein n=1 Tax=Dillenia turbinata TaxID=194707 RepID=A0AAN8Z5X0_9MAGN
MESQRDNNKRVRDDTSDEFDLDLPEVKRLRDDLLGFLDESDLTPTTQDLASVMRSFEEEILFSSDPPENNIVDLTSDSAESQPDLGFLLEASDDELGLPPSVSPNSDESKEDVAELSGIGELWGFDDEIPSYEFGICESNVNGNGNNNCYNGEYVALDGLFEYADDFSWHPETLPAL